MATQKQRRRRAKEQRHEYDVVYVDSEGNEVEVEGSDAAKPRTPPAKASARRTGKGDAKGQARSRGGRVAQPPSWRRVLKRGAIFAPLFFITVLLLGGDKMTYPAAVVQTVLLMAVFVPFSYFMDRLMWRQQEKRAARNG
jgi:hypothetical protein